MHVRVITDFEVLSRALTGLVTSLGFTAHTQDGPEVEVALAYLARSSPPYPAPAGKPTLALFPAATTRSSGSCSGATAAT